MEILYMSSLCSLKEYHRMFKMYGTTSSHASQKFHRLFVKGLVSNGYVVSTLSTRVISNPNNNDLVKNSERENEVVFNYLPHCKIAKFNRAFSILKTYSFLRNWFKDHPDSIVISDTINGEYSIAIFLYKLFHSITSVGLVLDVPAKRANEKRRGIKAIPFLIKNRLISCFDGYVFLTEAMNGFLNKKQKPYCVVEGIAEDNKNNNELKNKYKNRVVMMAGLLESVFGVDELLNAFTKLPDDDIELHFFGRGTSIDTILKYAERDNRIKYLGEKTNDVIMQEEVKSTVLVNPRKGEGEWTAFSFPSKNMEYIASGTPMLAYNLPCIPEEYLSFFYQIDSLDEALQRALSKSREELHSFGMKAQYWITENKNSQKQIEIVSQMLKRMEGK